MPVFVIVLLSVVYVLGFCIKVTYSDRHGSSSGGAVLGGLLWPVLSLLSWGAYWLTVLASGDSFDNF